MSRNTVARIDLSALRHNLDVVKDLAADSRVVCVIKADGYGHGIQRVALALRATDQFAVATPGEARAVREAGWTGPLLLLEGFSNSDDYETARQLDLDLVIDRSGQLETLKSRGLSNRQRLWLKLDTGMHRLGFPAAILNFPELCRDYVRPGIMLYGVSPLTGHRGADHGLKLAMTLSCEIVAVNDCRAGDRVGYRAAYTCPRDTQIGVAAIGYGDGYPRHLRNGAPVLVNGRMPFPTNWCVASPGGWTALKPEAG